MTWTSFIEFHFMCGSLSFDLRHIGHPRWPPVALGLENGFEFGSGIEPYRSESSKLPPCRRQQQLGQRRSHTCPVMSQDIK